MIIQVIPETEQEKLNMDVVEHRGVREFMVFGNKVNEEGLLIDFHEWAGGYRYLIGSLHYFANIVDEERKNRSNFAQTGTVSGVPAPELADVIDMPINDTALQEKLDNIVEKVDDEDEDKDEGK
jgi:hypothetical protein